MYIEQVTCILIPLLLVFSLIHLILFQAKQTLAAECTDKELKVLKDEVRALHVSHTVSQFASEATYFTHQGRGPNWTTLGICVEF